MKTNRTVQRAIQMLSYTAAHPEGVSLDEYCEQLALPKTSAYDILVTLVQEGMLSIKPGPKQLYQIGIFAYRIGMSYPDANDTLKLISSELTELARTSDRTAFFGKLSNGEVVYLLKEVPDNPIITREYGAFVLYLPRQDAAGFSAEGTVSGSSGTTDHTAPDPLYAEKQSGAYGKSGVHPRPRLCTGLPRVRGTYGLCQCTDLPEKRNIGGRRQHLRLLPPQRRLSCRRTTHRPESSRDLPAAWLPYSGIGYISQEFSKNY